MADLIARIKPANCARAQLFAGLLFLAHYLASGWAGRWAGGRAFDYAVASAWYDIGIDIVVAVTSGRPE
jgi:hypothetical protein